MQAKPVRWDVQHSLLASSSEVGAIHERCDVVMVTAINGTRGQHLGVARYRHGTNTQQDVGEESTQHTHRSTLARIAQ